MIGDWHHPFGESETPYEPTKIRTLRPTPRPTEQSHEALEWLGGMCQRTPTLWSPLLCAQTRLEWAQTPTLCALGELTGELQWRPVVGATVPLTMSHCATIATSTASATSTAAAGEPVEQGGVKRWAAARHDAIDGQAAPSVELEHLLWRIGSFAGDWWSWTNHLSPPQCVSAPIGHPGELKMLKSPTDAISTIHWLKSMSNAYFEWLIKSWESMSKAHISWLNQSGSIFSQQLDT